MGYIYIMTNPALKDMVKIGYAQDVEQRRKQLSTTALPFDYEIYATYETSGNLEDKTLHSLIDNLNPDLRISKNREFFFMSAEEAYSLLEAIAIISGTKDKLKKKIKLAEKHQKKTRINFFECGIPIGAELSFVEDNNIKVIVASENKVEYKGEITSLSTIVKELKHLKNIPRGTAYFTYNGELLTDIAERTQWK